MDRSDGVEMIYLFFYKIGTISGYIFVALYLKTGETHERT